MTSWTSLPTSLPRTVYMIVLTMRLAVATVCAFPYQLIWPLGSIWKKDQLSFVGEKILHLKFEVFSDQVLTVRVVNFPAPFKIRFAEETSAFLQD